MDSPFTDLQCAPFFPRKTQKWGKKTPQRIQKPVRCVAVLGSSLQKLVILPYSGVRCLPVNGDISCRHWKRCWKHDQQSTAVATIVPMRWPWFEHSGNQAPRVVISVFHYVLTCIGMNDCTHTHPDSALCGGVSIPLPPCESLAIPDAGWSAEPGWPETISDPRGGCTLQWALRPWLKHQPLSMQRWRPDRRGADERSQKDEGVQSFVLLPLFPIKRQDLFIVLWAGL